MTTKSAQEIFGVTRKSPAEIFARARAPRINTRALYSGFKRRQPVQQLVIKTKDCATCGFMTTSITRYFCARCHFTGWWWS